MKLIKVTKTNGQVIKINPEQIVLLEPDPERAYVRLTGGLDMFTKENVDEIESLIQKADNL